MIKRGKCTTGCVRSSALRRILRCGAYPVLWVLEIRKGGHRSINKRRDALGDAACRADRVPHRWRDCDFTSRSSSEPSATDEMKVFLTNQKWDNDRAPLQFANA